MYKINPLLSWKKKGVSIVVYLNFNFIFFEKQPAIWIEQILTKKRIQKSKIPQAFMEYLCKREIIKK